MALNPRFWQGDRDDRDVMAAVDELEIKLLKTENGGVSGFFKMSGSFGDDLLADEDFAEPADFAETARFARKLMGLFSGGSGGSDGRRPPGAFSS